MNTRNLIFTLLIAGCGTGDPGKDFIVKSLEGYHSYYSCVIGNKAIVYFDDNDNIEDGYFIGLFQYENGKIKLEWLVKKDGIEAIVDPLQDT